MSQVGRAGGGRDSEEDDQKPGSKSSKGNFACGTFL